MLSCFPQTACELEGSGDNVSKILFADPPPMPNPSVGSGKGDKPSPVLCQRKRNLNKEFLTRLLRSLSTAWVLVSHKQAVSYGAVVRSFADRPPMSNFSWLWKGRQAFTQKEPEQGIFESPPAVSFNCMSSCFPQTGCELEDSGDKTCPKYLLRSTPELQLALDDKPSPVLCQRKGT